MRVSTTEYDFPYLAARGDNTGSFLQWLKELRVPYSHDVRVSDMIQWGWLQPSFRVLLPDKYFLSWTNFPSYLGEPRELDDDEVWADHLWWAAGGASDFLYRQLPLVGIWFVHPFDRLDNQYAAHAKEALEATTIPPVQSRPHPNSRTYYPWIDYLPYWKAYELIDVLPAVAVTNPIWLTDQIPEQLDNIKANLDTFTKWRRNELDRVHKAWQENCKVFTYIAHYRAMQAALTNPPRTVTAEHWERADAARALAKTLDVTAEELERLTQTRLLTQVNKWTSWEEREGTRPGVVALGHLQKDLLCAIEWLYYLTGKKYDDYCDAWSTPGREGQPSIELSKALPVEARIAEEYFLRHFTAFRGAYDLIPQSDRLTDNAVGRLVRVLRQRTYLFVDWLKRYQAFHEGLGGPPSWDWAGVTEHQLFDDLTLIALLTEKVLLDFVESSATATGTYPDFKNLVGLATTDLEATDHRFKGAWNLASTHWKTYTSLKNKPLDPFGMLRALTLTGAATPAALAKAILFFGLARNYFAHHSYRHHTLIQTPDGGAFFAGMTTTLLYLTHARTDNCTHEKG